MFKAAKVSKVFAVSKVRKVRKVLKVCRVSKVFKETKVSKVFKVLHKQGHRVFKVKRVRFKVSRVLKETTARAVEIRYL